MMYPDIHCCGCDTIVSARLTDGLEVYPRRDDLKDLPFWRCDDCGNFVGCHHKTDNPTNPLGVIATPEIKNARRHIHKLLDPLWQSGRVKRKKVYAYLTRSLGWSFHTSSIRSVDDARVVYRLLLEFKKTLP